MFRILPKNLRFTTVSHCTTQAYNYSEQDLHLQSIPATGLKPVVYSNFHHQSINIVEGQTRTA